MKCDAGCAFKKKTAWAEYFDLIFGVCGSFWPKPSVSVCLWSSPIAHTVHTAVLTWQNPLPSILMALTLCRCCLLCNVLYTLLIWKSIHLVELTHAWLKLFHWERLLLPAPIWLTLAASYTLMMKLRCVVVVKTFRNLALAYALRPMVSRTYHGFPP